MERSIKLRLLEQRRRLRISCLLMIPYCFIEQTSLKQLCLIIVLRFMKRGRANE